MFDLMIAAIFRNEALYLKEWIDFHLLMGCQKFFLFDNLSTDSPRKVLDPYLAEGVVELLSWPFDHAEIFEWNDLQCLAYERAIYSLKGKTKWLAILDVDEFLFSPSQPLLKALQPYEKYGGVAVNWQVFGTSHVERIPAGKRLIETLNWKLPEGQGINHHVKSIVRPECVSGCDNPHSMIYKPGFFQVNAEETPFEGRLSPTVRIETLRVNHYTLRDEHYLQTQKIPRLQNWWGESPPFWREKYAGMNQIEDKTIHKYLPLL